MSRLSKTVFRPWQYINVLLAIFLVILLEINVQFLRTKFVSTPFIVVSAVSAIYGDYLAGLLGVIGGTFSVGLIQPTGFRLEFNDIGRLIAFFISSSIILLLARYGKSLAVNNLSLYETIDQMDKASTKLKSQARIRKKELHKLNTLNNELRSVVDDIMEDKDLWAEEVKNEVQKKSGRSFRHPRA